MKGSLLFAFGRMPGGARLYRHLTRAALGTQATHVDKLNRVWPGYVKVWREQCGLELEGAVVGMFEGGWTPFPFLLNWLLTGRGGWVATHEGRMHARYVSRAIAAARQIQFEGLDTPANRMVALAALDRAEVTLDDVLAAVGGELYEDISLRRLPVESASTDLVHSGGSLEHLRPCELKEAVSEFLRVLKPGGVASHVFDHRDHLYHADKAYPFLNHLRFSDRSYELFFGHRLLYHSRLLPEEVVQTFVKAGFERVLLRRLVLPSGKYAESDEEVLGALQGIPRESLNRRFSGAAELDLHTAAVHYLFRKPK